MTKYALLCLFLVLSFLVGCSNDVEFQVRETSQDFAQDIKYNKTVDILFIIDDGSSMQAVQKQLSDQVPYLFGSLRDLNMDIHIATTSMTMKSGFPQRGKLIGDPKYITQDTPNFDEEMRKKIFIGEQGSSLEEGLASMEVVLGESYRSTEGKGFLRNDSFLNIIVLTNEDDKSPESWKHYAEFLDKLRPNHADGTKSWAMNFFGIVSMDDPCNSSAFGPHKEPGFKFMELVTYSGGVKGSICGTDLYKSVSSIRARLIQILTDYKLSKNPQVATIKVFVAGREVPRDDTNGWTYIAAQNLIRFNGTAVPKADEGIRVDFLPTDAE